MRKGKMVAQGAHASMRAMFGNVPTYTAVAVGPDREDRVDAITGMLPLL